MNVPVCSSTPSGWMRMKVHAMPKNRSSRMKRSRQERRLMVPGGSSRNCRQARMMTRWMISAPAVHTPEVSAPVHSADKKPDGDHEQQDHQRSRQPVLRELAQQFVVEDRPRAAGRGQPVARFAHVLGGKRGAWSRARRRRAKRPRAVRWGCLALHSAAGDNSASKVAANSLRPGLRLAIRGVRTRQPFGAFCVSLGVHWPAGSSRDKRCRLKG